VPSDPRPVAVEEKNNDADVPKVPRRAVLSHLPSPHGQLSMSDPSEAFRFLMSAAYPGALAPEHRDDLEASGLLPHTIDMHGFRSVPPTMIGQLIGWDSRRIRSAMVVPYPDPIQALAARDQWLTLAWMDHVVVKVFPPFRPRDKDGKETKGTVKYAQPKGTPPRLYFPWPCLFAVVTPGAPLWIVEGAKKALAAAQAGLVAVGFSGIQGWHRKGSRELLPDFDWIPLAGRAVEFVPDADVQTNPAVARGAQRFKAALAARGAKVRLVLLPKEIAA
jgi:Domain of unknown function (DUF3854)